MSVWLLIIVSALLVGAALVYSGRASLSRDRSTAKNSENGSANEEQFRKQLAEIDADVKSGRLDGNSANAAKSELARELVFHRANLPGGESERTGALLKFVLPGVSLVVIIAAIATYSMLGAPELPGAPMSTRLAEPGNPIVFSQAIDRVELQLASTPDDIEGWRALAPAYIQIGRFADAVNAYRRILQLAEPNAESLTNLAQALMQANEGVMDDEALGLLQSAADLDKQHARSRFILAGAATNSREWDEAVEIWSDLLALGTGDEPWFNAANSGLRFALARGVLPEPEETGSAQAEPELDASQIPLIREMVSGLTQRLENEGGSIEEWTRLVRSRIVLGDTDLAQTSYDQAKLAFPDPADRIELDNLVEQAGLPGNGE